MDEQVRGTSDLAARIKAAEGRSIGLDAEIELAVGNWTEHHYEQWFRFQECGGSVNPPMFEPVGPNRYTASLDAALMLVPEGWFWVASTTPSGGYARLQHPERGLLLAYASTPALALAATALRAKENDRA